MGKGGKNVSNVKEYLKQGIKNEKSGHFKDAIENYSKAFDESNDHFLLYKRGCLYQKIGEMEKAAEDFETFLSADTRRVEGGSMSYVITETVNIENQRLNAKKTLSQVTFQKILKPSVPFDFYYLDKKFYNWGQVQISGSSEETLMLEKNPQEAAYRKGIKCFLQGKHEKAIQYLDEAITINPEDARSYLFRSMVHALQSQKGGLFGPSSSAKESSKAKFESDLERALALSKNNEVVKRACLRAKYWLVDYAKQYECELASQRTREGTPAANFLVLLGIISGIILSIASLATGIGGFFMSSLPGFSPILPPIFLVCGVLALFGVFSFVRGKKIRGVFFLIIAFLIYLAVFWIM